MLLGIIADDFTGASDIANTVAKGLAPEGGLKTVQYLGVPRGAAGGDVEAGIVSLKSRSIAADEAVQQSLEALDWLEAQGCRQVILKYCSTFDSTPAGNIGPVGEALAQRMGVRGVVACPAFPDAGRTVYKGHLFVGDRLLNKSGMEHHPLNPMTDGDLRRWLRMQTQEAVGHLDWSVVRQGRDALREGLARTDERLVIVDALTNADLLTIAEASAEARLLTGGSGVALGLPRNFIRAGEARGGRPMLEAVDGPEAILVGSCSAMTVRQIEAHAKTHPVMAIDVDRVMDGALAVETLVEFVMSNAGKAALVYSASKPENVAALQQRYGGAKIARKLDAIFAGTAKVLFDEGVRRFVVGGGETSGAVVSALGVTAFRIGPEIDPGVPALMADDGRGLAMALKSGNFGGLDFFEKALAVMAGERKTVTE